MSKKFDDDIVRDTIEELSKSGDFSVSELARVLSVSRGYIYNHYRHLIEKNEDTDKKILEAVKDLQDSKGTKKLTINAVANKAKLSRQTISTGYKHLHPYISGAKALPAEFDTEDITLAGELRRLKDSVVQMKREHAKELEDQKHQYLTELMIKDSKLHEIQSTELSLNKLQVQNDELSAQNRKYLSELVGLKGELAQARNKMAGGLSTEVIGHFRCNYEELKTTTSTADALKIFLKLEKLNLEKAIESCITSAPDAVMFFQPFLSCGIDGVKIKVDAKRIVIIESNCFLPRDYSKLTNALNGTPIHAITTRPPDLTVSRVFCRQKYGDDVFHDDFLKSIFDKIIPPTLDCGFESVSTFSPRRTPLSLVT